MLGVAMRGAVAVVVVGALAGSAHADSTQKLVDEATKLYETADLAGALAKFEQAYAQSKRSDILFSMARIHVDRGNCPKAIEMYRLFLESKPKPGPRSTQIATEKIAECQKIIASAEPAKSEPPPVPAPAPEPAPAPAPVPSPVVAAPATRTVERPWYTDVVGDLLVVGGVVGIGVGAYFFSAARDDVEQANAGGPGGVSADEYVSLRDRAERRHTYAAISGGIGGALLVGGIIKYAIGDRTEVVPMTSASAGGVAIRGRF
jgi:hypothetical protein